MALKWKCETKSHQTVSSAPFQIEAGKRGETEIEMELENFIPSAASLVVARSPFRTEYGLRRRGDDEMVLRKRDRNPVDRQLDITRRKGENSKFPLFPTKIPHYESGGLFWVM